MTVNLGKALLQARTEQGRSLQVVGAEAKVSPAYLQKLEAGRVGSPNPRILARLGDALGLAYTDLMQLAGYLPISGHTNAPGGAESAQQRVVPTGGNGPQASGPIPRTNQEVLTSLRQVERRLSELLEGQERIASTVQSLLER